jgi:hypothetical protein
VYVLSKKYKKKTNDDDVASPTRPLKKEEEGEEVNGDGIEVSSSGSRVVSPQTPVDGSSSDLREENIKFRQEMDEQGHEVKVLRKALGVLHNQTASLQHVVASEVRGAHLAQMAHENDKFVNSRYGTPPFNTSVRSTIDSDSKSKENSHSNMDAVSWNVVRGAMERVSARVEARSKSKPSPSRESNSEGVDYKKIALELQSKNSALEKQLGRQESEITELKSSLTTILSPEPKQRRSQLTAKKAEASKDHNVVSPTYVDSPDAGMMAADAIHAMTHALSYASKDKSSMNTPDFDKKLVSHYRNFSPPVSLL